MPVQQAFRSGRADVARDPYPDYCDAVSLFCLRPVQFTDACFLGETFIWEGHAFGTKQLSYIIMADGIINVLVQIFLLGWLSRYVTERNLILLIFTLIGCGFMVAGLAGTIPVLALAVLCISTGDALAKPTYLAALSVHAPPERQGVVLGSAQAMNAVTDIFSPRWVDLFSATHFTVSGSAQPYPPPLPGPSWR